MVKVPTLVGEPVIKQEHGDVILECAADSNPTPTVTWTKDDKEINEGDDYKFYIEATTPDKYKVWCVIQNFSKPLAGVYKCTLKNDQGQSAASFTVAAGEAPEFVEKPHIIQREGGNILIIKVKVKSKKEAKVEWIKNETPVKETDRLKLTSKKDEKEPTECIYMLEIKGPVKEDEAKYTCTIKNDEGSSSQSLNLCFD